MHGLKTIVITILLSASVGSICTALILQNTKATPTAEDRIRDFYATETAVHVSPHGLRKELDKGGGNFVLVDLRSQEEYEREHIVSAVNVPAYSDPDTAAYDEVERIAGQFETIRAQNPGKDIVVYCYSGPCMTGRKIGAMLAEHGIYVKHLGIGWNEWRYYTTLWNHEHEWSKVHSEDYVASGAEPGKPTIQELPSPCGEGSFGC